MGPEPTFHGVYSEVGMIGGPGALSERDAREKRLGSVAGQGGMTGGASARGGCERGPWAQRDMQAGPARRVRKGARTGGVVAPTCRARLAERAGGRAQGLGKPDGPKGQGGRGGRLFSLSFMSELCFPFPFCLIL